MCVPDPPLGRQGGILAHPPAESFYAFAFIAAISFWAVLRRMMRGPGRVPASSCVRRSAGDTDGHLVLVVFHQGDLADLGENRHGCPRAGRGRAVLASAGLPARGSGRYDGGPDRVEDGFRPFAESCTPPSRHAAPAPSPFERAGRGRFALGPNPR